MKRKKPGRHKIGRITVTLRLFPETQRLVAKVARLQKIGHSDYAEALFWADFRARGLVSGPDFAAFFAKHPLFEPSFTELEQSENQRKKASKKPHRYWCAVCDKEFDAFHEAKTCSPRCRKALSRSSAGHLARLRRLGRQFGKARELKTRA